jgi:hypothetical protein
MAIETGLPVAEAVPRVAPVVQAESSKSDICPLSSGPGKYPICFVSHLDFNGIGTGDI